MSTYFSKVMKAGERMREFNFRLASANDDSRYTVDVPDDKGNRVIFSMFKNADGDWKIAAQLMPLWIHEAETQLANAIESNWENEVAKKNNFFILTLTRPNLPRSNSCLKTTAFLIRKLNITL
jgi:hypothetical protein